MRARLDLAVGALDAHLHPWWVPAWPVAAAAAGGVAWTFAGAVALGQPVPPDWPGYLQETLPVFLAASPLLLLATLGASTRLGPWDPVAVRAGRPVAVVGWVAWILLLVCRRREPGRRRAAGIRRDDVGGGDPARRDRAPRRR